MELRIQQVMLEKGVTTQKELASRMGISATTLSRSLRCTPKLETLEKIAEALQCKITDFFEPNYVCCPHCGQPIEFELRKKI